MPRFYIAVHRVVEDLHKPQLSPPTGALIDIATRAKWGDRFRSPPGGWTFAAGPATHAFVIVEDDNGKAQRIDAGPPVTEKEDVEWDLLPRVAPQGVPGRRMRFEHPTAVWQVVAAPDIDPVLGIAKALAEVGTPYDFAQVLTQALAPLVPDLLTGAVPWQGLRRGDICTESACHALEACGGAAMRLARDVMDRDHYPEELAHKASLCVCEGGWLRRVV